MSEFKLHSVESAPEASKAILEGAQQRMGGIPGLYFCYGGIARTVAELHAAPSIFH